MTHPSARALLIHPSALSPREYEHYSHAVQLLDRSLVRPPAQQPTLPSHSATTTTTAATVESDVRRCWSWLVPWIGAVDKRTEGEVSV